jgi:hypothetical protein
MVRKKILPSLELATIREISGLEGDPGRTTL